MGSMATPRAFDETLWMFYWLHDQSLYEAPCATLGTGTAVCCFCFGRAIMVVSLVRLSRASTPSPFSSICNAQLTEADNIVSQISTIVSEISAIVSEISTTVSEISTTDFAHG
jgi:hypothetical protein